MRYSLRTSMEPQQKPIKKKNRLDKCAICKKNISENNEEDVLYDFLKLDVTSYSELVGRGLVAIFTSLVVRLDRFFMHT